MNQLSRRLANLRQFADRIPSLAHREFVAKTPVRSGNARRSTDLRTNEIQANYPYAVRLEKESWSKQAPNGMTEPTVETIRSQLRSLR